MLYATVGPLTPVSRIESHSHNLNTHLTLDIANELYPLSANETFTLAVARSLVPEELEAAQADAEDGDAEGEGSRKVRRELWRSDDQGLAADYEYVMYGKVGTFGFSRLGRRELFRALGDKSSLLARLGTSGVI